MRNWWRSYLLLMRWTLLLRRVDLPLMVVLQLLISTGIVVGFSFLLPSVDPTSALYLTTGAMTISLITVAISIAPQMIAQQKLQGILDYQRAMPVPRSAVLAADTTIWAFIALPGTLLSLAIALSRFRLHLAVSPLVVPAVILVAGAGIGVGYCIAYAVRASLVGIVTNAVLVGSLMFAPINYPASRLPTWLATIHEYLPFAPMARVIRETISPPQTGIAPMPFVVLAIWAVAGIALALRIMTRRT